MAESAATFDEFQKAREFSAARRFSRVSPSGLAKPIVTSPTIPSRDQMEGAPARERTVVDADQARAREFREKIRVMVHEKNLAAAMATIRETVTIAHRVTKEGSAWLSWAFWGAALDNIIGTFGLSLLIFPLFHVPLYGVKILKFPGHQYLCAPGDDGLIGQIPPPRIPLGIINRVYGLVNLIALGCIIVAMIFLLIAAVVILMLPLILFVAIVGAVAGMDFGALGNYIKIIFSLS